MNALDALRLAVTLFAAVGVLAGTASLLLAHRATLRRFRNAAPPRLPADPPPVSLLKPIEGADERTFEALSSLCVVDYPGRVELLVGTMRRDDPVVAVVERLQAAFPDRDIRLVFAEPLGANRKTAIMAALVDAATTDLLIFSDADARVPADYLHHVVPPLLDASVGTVTCLPRGVGLETRGGVAVALHYGHVYLPQWMLALATTGVEWAIGNTMAQRRAVHEAYGGFRAFPDRLADDYEFANRAVRQGLRVVVPPLLIDTQMPRESLPAAIARLRRWSRTIRRARPKAFPGVALTMPLGWALVLALANSAAPWAWLVLAAVVALRLALAAALDRAVVRTPAPGWLAWLPVVDLIDFYCFFAAYTGTTITWAGRRYRLLGNGDLQPLDETR